MGGARPGGPAPYPEALPPFYLPPPPLLYNARRHVGEGSGGPRWGWSGLRMPRGSGKRKTSGGGEAAKRREKEEEEEEEEEAGGGLEAALRAARRAAAPSVREFRYNKKRVRLVSRGPELREDAKCILYWMSRDQRVQGKDATPPHLHPSLELGGAGGAPHASPCAAPGSFPSQRIPGTAPVLYSPPPPR